MGCPSTVVLENNLVFSVCTHDPDTGVLTDADIVPSYRIYEDETTIPILTGDMAKLDDDNTTGFYTELIACTAVNGFEDGKTYTIYIEATVDSDTGGISYGFTVESAGASAADVADIAAATDAILTDTGTDGVAIVNGGITAAKIATAALDADAMAADLDTYQAKVWLFDDEDGSNDHYVACWYKNGMPITSGITTPLVQVIKAADGTDLVGSTAMAQIGGLGLYRYDEDTNRIINGVAYIAKVTATIGGSARTWYQPVGRDS